MILPLLSIPGKWGENAGILGMLSAYPEQLPALAEISYAFTKLKYVSATASMPLVLVGLAALVIRRLLRKRDDGSSSPFATRQ